MRIKLFLSLSAVGLALFSAPVAHANVTLPAIFGDHMVLQQGSKLPVWGWADPGEKVTVEFGKSKGSAVAGADGNWRVDLPAITGSPAPGELTVTGKNKVSFQDVLVGEVWIASGQSNMEFGIQTEFYGAEAIRTATDSQIRMLFVPWNTALEPQKQMGKPRQGDLRAGKWQVCSPEMMADKWAWNGFSAAGYYFAKELRKSTGRPVGMIAAYKGGTPAQSWTSVSGLSKEPPFTNHLEARQKIVDNFAAATEKYPKQVAEFQTAFKQWNEEVGKTYNAAVAQWKEESVKAKAAGQKPAPSPTPAKPMPRQPAPPDGGYGAPGNLFNGMIAPLVPYAIKGVIWYQGEGNGGQTAQAIEYATLFPRMISDWREKWALGDFAFLFVQLANFTQAAKTPSEGVWAWVREAQLKTLSLPNTGMASAVDIGDAADIHPTDKLHVGQRLALAARHVAYGEKLVYSGPIYRSMKTEGKKIRLSFDQCGSGLVLGVPPWAPGGVVPPAAKELKGFGIAGKDQAFVWAKAVIEGNQVIVSSDEVPEPVAVRYNWANNPPGNLYNKEGLPASPFRTDDWQPPQGK